MYSKVYLSIISGFLYFTEPCVVFTQSVPLLTIPQVVSAPPGWSTELVLRNPGPSVLSGFLRFHGRAGQKGKAVRYSLKAAATARIMATAFGVSNETGYVRISPDKGHSVPNIAATLTRIEHGHITAEFVIPASAEARSFQVPAEVVGAAAHLPGAVRTGLAIANPSPSPANITVRFNAAHSTSFVIPGNSHLSAFVDDLPGLNSKLKPPFRGVIQVESTTDVALVAIRGRWNDRAEFEGNVVVIQK